MAQNLPAEYTIEPEAMERVFTRVPVLSDPMPGRSEYKGGKKIYRKREFLYRLQNGHCAYCDHSFPYEMMTVDHVLARINGGTDDISNLVVCCQECNVLKGSFRTFEEADAFIARKLMAMKRRMDRYMKVLALFKRLRDKGFIR